MTSDEIRKNCNFLKEGDHVLIVKAGKEEDGKTSREIKTKGKVIKKYPNFVLIGKGIDFKTLESFTYAEIAGGCIVKEKEKKNARR